ncbi:hypothetical protein [Caulobacter segnis]|uniref:hypothetical protein n=1 Tax=Caulobacter segnis TaxID=88688 RepID=UPI002854E7F5|nr:hypothetical protein [Caulobacter segnis]MDR6624835.1 hypothetical protein [Caulobacter segnis]
MTLVDLTYLQFNLIAVIDAGSHQGVSFGDVKAAVRSGNLFAWLEQQFPNDVDMSLYREGRGRELISALTDALEGLDGRERKKTGVEHNGVCLLLALTTEAIQRKGWEK